MKKYVFGLFLGMIFCSSFTCLGVSPARADMLIVPTQVVFEGRERFGSVTLVNTGDKTNTYELGWQYFDMQEGIGSYKMIDKPSTDFDLSKHIVFAPRRVTLAPGAKQKVRLALRRPAEIPDGDYHVHFKFRSVPNDDLDIDNQGEGASMGVSIAVSYAIPVVLRSGEVKVQAEIGEISLARDEVSGFVNVAVPVSRSGGNHSILGYLRVYHIGDDGKEDLLGVISNANMFPEINNRVFDVHLTKEFSGGSLKVVLRYFDKKNDFIYAERSFDVE